MKTSEVNRFALTCVALFLAVGLQLALARSAHGLHVIAIGGGLLTGLLVTSPRNRWLPSLLAGGLGSVAAGLLFAQPSPEPWLLAAALVSQAAVAASVFVVLFGQRPASGAPLQLLWAGLAASLAGCAIAGTLVAFAGTLGGSEFTPTFLQWTISQLLGVAIFATLTVAAHELGVDLFGRPGARARFALDVAAVAALAGLVFWQSRYPLLYLVFPPLLLLVFRHRLAGAVVGTLVISGMAVGGTLSGSGPLLLIPGASGSDTYLVLQVFIATNCLLAFPAAAGLAERERLANALRESEASYRLLAENSRDVIVRTREDGSKAYISPAVEEMLGWRREELEPARWDLVHPDDRQRAVAAYKDLRAGSAAFATTYRVLHRDGRYRWLEVLARRVERTPGAGAEIIHSARDITPRIELENELADNQRRLRALADSLPAMVAYVDAEQRYRFLNAHAGAIFGIDPEDTIGKTILEARGEQVHRRLQPHVEAALRGEHVAFRLELDVAGKHRHFEWTMVPDVDANGTVHGYFTMAYEPGVDAAADRDASPHIAAGLASPEQFEERLALALARTERHRQGSALVVFEMTTTIDAPAIDPDTPQRIASRLAACLRQRMLAHLCTGNRYVVLVEAGDAGGAAERLANRFRAALTDAAADDGGPLPVETTTRIAVAAAGDTPESLLGRVGLTDCFALAPRSPTVPPEPPGRSARA